MSMTTLVILRFAGIFAAYTGLTVLLPAIMFRRILVGRGLSEQFLMCYTFGNFYIINIVFAVQLLHISGFWALVLFTAVPGILIWSRVNRVSLRELCIKTGIICKKILQGSMGMRGALYRVCNRIKAVLKRSVRLFYYKVICNTLQWILVGAVIIALFWIYGRNLLLTYGYCASDIPVHLNWINEMVRGNLFSDGVYPFGFHCMIYYLHTVFRVDTYAILCVFYLVQVFFIHMVLLAVMKLLCRSLYLPYAGVLVYILGNLWAKQTYSRFGASLPQEFGMIFVIPSVYFLISFFQTEKEKLKTRETKLLSGCFALAFSLTLAIHFYGTMIAGLCCIGIAVGFCPRFLNKEYFKRIMMTGIISVFLAVLPMGIAFAGGTPLQGSLGWGLSVINGDKSDTEDEEASSEDKTIQDITILLGLIFIILRKTTYGEMLMSAGFCMGILTLLLCASGLGLPMLMDPARCSIYYVYLLILTLTVLMDGILYLIFMHRLFTIPRNVLSFILTVSIVGSMIHQGMIKMPGFGSDYVSNGALTCLSNIIKENEDKTWTIVSANDETQMGLDHGWHYETITFLRNMEYMNKDTKLIIPTKNVYFFIEKIPLNYAVLYSGSGQSISKKAASQSLPNSGGITMYQGEGRWILMSRMYYWAQAFKERYPNDMKVYYESEDFVCYVMPQNMYHQYNFAIDYGYNQFRTKEDKN